MRRGLVAAAILVESALLARPQLAAGDAGSKPALQHTLDRIRSEPNAPAPFADLAAWLFRQGDLARARAAAAEAVRLDPGIAANQRLLGYIAAAAGDDAAAEAALTRAATLDPAARTSLADFHLARAWAGYQEALRRNGPEPALLQRLRDIAAAAEISPELKSLMHGGWPEEVAAPERVPPIHLGEGVDTAVVVEKSTQTVRLHGRGSAGVVLLKSYPCTTGQATGAKQERGDLKTPDGVYFVRDLLSGERLPGQYGALALPLDYPNAWDRQARRSGHGIWFHGSDRLASPFTPRDTQGCVLLRNDDLVELAGWIKPLTTPILVAEQIPDRPLAEWQAEMQRLLHGRHAPAAFVLGPQYAVVLQRGSEHMSYDFLDVADGGTSLHAEVEATDTVSWEEKLRAVVPETAATLERVTVPGGEDRIVLETSAPIHPHLFRPELGRRIYIDLAGARFAPVPESIPGSGAIAEVVVTTVSLDPPLTRLAIEVNAEVTPRLEAHDNTLTVILEAAAPRRTAARQSRTEGT